VSTRSNGNSSLLSAPVPQTRRPFATPKRKAAGGTATTHRGSARCKGDVELYSNVTGHLHVRTRWALVFGIKRSGKRNIKWGVLYPRSLPFISKIKGGGVLVLFVLTIRIPGATRFYSTSSGVSPI